MTGHASTSHMTQALLYEPTTSSPAGALPLQRSSFALPWPPELRSRLLRAIEACQGLDVDRAIHILLLLDLELGAIDRDCEKEYPWQ